MRFLRPPEATEAGHILAKLRNPKIAALRSSSRVALCKRPLRVAMVEVAFCFAGACFSRMLNISANEMHSFKVSQLRRNASLANLRHAAHNCQ